MAGDVTHAVAEAVLALTDRLDAMAAEVGMIRRLLLIVHSRVPRAGCLLTVAKAATQLGVSRQTLRRWIEEGAPCVKTPGRGAKAVTRVDVFAVLGWISRTWPDRGGKARKAARRRRRVTDVEV